MEKENELRCRSCNASVDKLIRLNEMVWICEQCYRKAKEGEKNADRR